MPYDPDKHHRRSIRLKNYDYNQPGSYFVTICTDERVCVFGNVVDNRVCLNDAGLIVQGSWNSLPQRFSDVELDEFIIMPNHLHGIITVGAQFIAPNGSNKSHIGQISLLGQIIRTFKASAAYQIHKTSLPEFAWQVNYHERIIRKDGELDRIRRQYIINNPIRWTEKQLLAIEEVSQ